MKGRLLRRAPKYPFLLVLVSAAMLAGCSKTVPPKAEPSNEEGETQEQPETSAIEGGPLNLVHDVRSLAEGYQEVSGQVTKLKGEFDDQVGELKKDLEKANETISRLEKDLLRIDGKTDGLERLRDFTISTLKAVILILGILTLARIVAKVSTRVIGSLILKYHPPSPRRVITSPSEAKRSARA